MVLRDLDLLGTSQTMTLTQDGCEFTCTGQNEKEAGSVKETLIRHMCFWGWESDSKKIQEPDCSGTNDISGGAVVSGVLSKV